MSAADFLKWSAVFGALTKGNAGSVVGGLSNGSPGNTFPGGFKSQSFVRKGQTLQAAIDAAPASNSLVSVITAGIIAFGSVYTVPAAAKPGAFFMDAMNAQETPSAFSGTTLVDPDGFYTRAFIWTYDAANSRIICYNQGNAVTQAALVNYHAVVAVSQASYDSVIMRPGIIVLGMGTGVSEIRNYTGAVLPQSIIASTEYSVVAASYSGLAGIDIVRNAKMVASPLGFSAIVFSPAISADFFVVMDSHIYVEPSVIDTPGGGYSVGVFFGCATNQGGRAKNVQFVRCLVESFSGRDVYETYSFQFSGLIIFRDCQIHGGAYVDGLTNTFIFINTPYTNLSSINRARAITNSSVAGTPYAISMGTLNPFPGYTEAYTMINSPHYVTRPDDINIAKMYVFGYVNNSTGRVGIYNSDITADGFITRATAGTAVPSTQANIIRTKSSRTPQVEITTTGTGSSGYSLTTPTPLNPKTFTQQTYATQTTTPKPLGIMSVLLEDLQDRGEVRAYARGKFAANVNMKTLQVQTGANVTLASLVLANLAGASVASMLSGVNWEYHATLRISGSTVLVSGSIDVGGTVTRFTTEQALTAAQYFQMVLLATGVATNDITVSYQSTEAAG